MEFPLSVPVWPITDPTTEEGKEAGRRHALLVEADARIERIDRELVADRAALAEADAELEAELERGALADRDVPKERALRQRAQDAGAAARPDVYARRRETAVRAQRDAHGEFIMYARAHAAVLVEELRPAAEDAFAALEEARQAMAPYELAQQEAVARAIALADIATHGVGGNSESWVIGNDGVALPSADVVEAHDRRHRPDLYAEPEQLEDAAPAVEE